MWGSQPLRRSACASQDGNVVGELGTRGPNWSWPVNDRSPIIPDLQSPSVDRPAPRPLLRFGGIFSMTSRVRTVNSMSRLGSVQGLRMRSETEIDALERTVVGHRVDHHHSRPDALPRPSSRPAPRRARSRERKSRLASSASTEIIAPHELGGETATASAVLPIPAVRCDKVTMHPKESSVPSPSAGARE